MDWENQIRVDVYLAAHFAIDNVLVGWTESSLAQKGLLKFSVIMYVHVYCHQNIHLFLHLITQLGTSLVSSGLFSNTFFIYIHYTIVQAFRDEAAY
jgi:hypothetical protein